MTNFVFLQFEDAVEELDEDGDVSTTFGKFRYNIVSDLGY